MVSKRKSAPDTKHTSGPPSHSPSPYDTFPLSRYASLLGSQTLGLGFTLAMLPTTRVLESELASLFGMQDSHKSSQDHPQHPYIDKLTDCPARTLFWLCAGSFVLVAWSAGSLRIWHVAANQTQSDVARDTRDASKPEQGKTLWGVAVEVVPTPARLLALRDAFAACLCALPAVVLLVLLFGAPLASHLIPTSFLALLMTILIVWTPAYTFGLPGVSSTLVDQEKRQKLIDLFVELSVRSPVERAVVYPIAGSIIGCWLGALVMPLDWDRPWQAWPLASAYMAIVGHVIGAGTSLAVSISQFLLIESEAETKGKS